MRTFTLEGGFTPNVADDLDHVECFAEHVSPTNLKTGTPVARIDGELFRLVLAVGGAVRAEVWSSPDSVIVELGAEHVRCPTHLDALACLRWFAPLLRLPAAAPAAAGCGVDQ